MANGATVCSEATWTGTIQVEDIKATGMFEVFNSQDGWSFLFGKPLLRAFKAIHDYATDCVTISDGTTVMILRNQYHSNDILQNGLYNIEVQKDITTTPEPNTTVFTRQTDPFAAPRVDYIVRNVQIGTDLTPGERKKVIDLLTEFADVFACSLSKVLPIPGANIDLNISEDVTLHTTVHQWPMNAPQRQFMSKWIDQMHSADLIELADIPQIKHVVPTVLTQKMHEASGSMSLEDLCRELNKQCEHAKLAQPFDEEVGAAMTQQRAKKPPNEPLKWRVTQNFAELNKITQILPMFQGDIRAKQQ